MIDTVVGTLCNFHSLSPEHQLCEVHTIITILQMKLKEAKELALAVKVTVVELARESTLPLNNIGDSVFSGKNKNLTHGEVNRA